MKHLKILEPGYGKFSGYFGTVEFKDGVSIKPVTSIEALRMAALLRVEQVGEEQDETIDMRVNFSAPVAQPVEAAPTAPAAGEQVDGKKWTRAELEEIADKHGIKGVREIAGPMGISGKSIAELISAIVSA